MAGHTIATMYGIPHPAIISHRGAAYWAPETTRPSFELAIAVKPDYIEFDVQRTKDGVLFTFHDDTAERTTNIAEVYPTRTQDPVGSFTWDELKKLDAGSWYNTKYPDLAREKYKGQSILSLTDVIDILSTADVKTGMYLETKSPELYPGIEAEIIQLLQTKGWITASGDIAKHRIILESFHADSVLQFQQLAPKIPRSHLFNRTMQEKLGRSNILANAKKIGHGIGPNAHLITPLLVYNAHQENLLIHTYTVNSYWQMRALFWSGVDGVFSDRPEVAIQLCRRQTLDIPNILTQLGY